MTSVSSGPLPRAGEFVIEPGVVLTDAGPAEQMAVVVVGDAFAQVVPRTEVTHPGHEALTRFRCPDLALVPGFVDCHNHADEAFAKATVCGEPAQIWKRIWIPLTASMAADDVYVAAKWTALELLRGGITTVVFSGDAVGEKSAAALRAITEVGVRCVFSFSFSDRADFHTPAVVNRERPTTAQCLRAAEQVLGTASPSSRVRISLACPGIQSASPELITKISMMCADAGALFQIHANEHTPEVEYCIDEYGRRPVELLADLGALGPHALLAHTTLVTPREVALLDQTRSGVSYNPVASAWKGNAVAPALEFAARGIRFGLGTDGTRNDGFRLLEASEFAQRVTRGMPVVDFSAGAGGVWVHAATAGGADAAGLGRVTGSIAAGKRADFLLLDRDVLECQPSHDFVWELIRYYDRTNLVASYIDGELMVDRGQVVRCDVDAFVRENAKRGREVVERAPVKRVHGRSRLADSYVVPTTERP